MGDAGYVVGQNVAIEYRWAEGHYDRLPALASDLVGRQVAVIASFGGNAPALAAKAATANIPIIFTTGSDPIATGLVASLNRPGSNMTGVHMFSGGLETKRLGLLRELAPFAAVIAVLVNPTGGAGTEAQLKALQAAAREVGQQIQIVNAQNERDLDSAFATIEQSGSKALLVTADPEKVGAPTPARSLGFAWGEDRDLWSSYGEDIGASNNRCALNPIILSC